ncbi:unnamed protein product [marine sediment metagenome]|uniref:Uncharacterized protein n=1 Tax=marine sediment metagenome TaxID=412755 RepID=X1G2V3_9ZZZZ
MVLLIVLAVILMKELVNVILVLYVDMMQSNGNFLNPVMLAMMLFHMIFAVIYQVKQIKKGLKKAIEYMKRVKQWMIEKGEYE